MKAFLKNYRQSPRKVRLVAGLMKGKSVESAISELDFLVKRAGMPVKKLLLSAVANAKAQGKEVSDLFIKDLRVDKGIVMKRMMPRAMGRGARINKRTSHVTLVLGEKADKMVTKGKKAVKAAKERVMKAEAKVEGAVKKAVKKVTKAKE